MIDRGRLYGFRSWVLQCLRRHRRCAHQVIAWEGLFRPTYDRLSPSTDQSPKWYCESCSMQKNLQRDFRDITAEIDKLASGQASQLSKPDELQRAALRVREIVALLDVARTRSPLLASSEVNVYSNDSIPSLFQPKPGLFMNTCYVVRSSRPAGLFSFGLLDGLQVRLRRPYLREAPAGFGLERLATAFMNNPG